ncbi:hypothetical protein FB451DRAFT_1291225 [Mycena latifolia]|nr:hypothetical protein FB451DRAFT_1291225 [Mycena latifolia]
MHPALLLDDVLRQILDLCPTACLPAVARTCVAWRDPALDGIWCHLGSLVPLLNLIPGLLCVDGVYNVPLEGPLDLRIFSLYAVRVKHITQRRDTRVHPALLSILSKPGITLLNMLTTTRLSSTDPHSIPAVLSLSPSLRQLDLDFGFKNKGVADASSEYIEKILRVATNIERIRLRGSASQRLNAGISQMSNLRSLTLRTGASFLTADTLVAISAFPRLAELDIEAGHLDIDDLAKAWPLPVSDAGYFQSLQKLHVCAQAPVLELLLKIIQPGCLHTLRFEATTSSSSASPVVWSSLFDLIRANASQTLEDLTIEHHLEDIDLDTIPTTSTGTDIHPSAQNTRPQNNQITFDIIRLLAPLRNLRRLTIDMTCMPDLCDEDIEALATWWPGLTAPLPGLSTFPAGNPRLSPVPSLPPSAASNALSGATFTSSAPPPDPAAMAHYLHGLFPCLTELEGTDRHEVEWGQVQRLLHGPQKN